MDGGGRGVSVLRRRSSHLKVLHCLATTAQSHFLREDRPGGTVTTIQECDTGKHDWIVWGDEWWLTTKTQTLT